MFHSAMALQRNVGQILETHFFKGSCNGSGVVGDSRYSKYMCACCKTKNDDSVLYFMPLVIGNVSVNYDVFDVCRSCLLTCDEPLREKLVSYITAHLTGKMYRWCCEHCNTQEAWDEYRANIRRVEEFVDVEKLVTFLESKLEGNESVWKYQCEKLIRELEEELFGCFIKPAK